MVEQVFLEESKDNWRLPWLLSSKESTSLQEMRAQSWVKKILWRRKRQPTPVFLPGKFQGQRSPVNWSPWGQKIVRHNLATKQQLKKNGDIYFKYLWDIRMKVSNDKLDILLQDSRKGPFSHSGHTDTYRASPLLSYRQAMRIPAGYSDYFRC